VSRLPSLAENPAQQAERPSKVLTCRVATRSLESAGSRPVFGPPFASPLGGRGGLVGSMTMINCWVGTRDARAEDRGIASRC
jgi:hypothetical protein